VCEIFYPQIKNPSVFGYGMMTVMNGNNPAGPAPMPDNNKEVLKAPNIGAQPSTPPPPPPLPPPPPPQQQSGGSAVPPPPTREVDIRTMASDGKSLKSSGGVSTKPKTFNPSDLIKEPIVNNSIRAGDKLPKSKKKISLIIVGIVVVLGASAATAFFFILPQFQGEEIVNETPKVEEVQIPEQEVVIPPLVHTSFFSKPVELITPVNLNILEYSEILSALKTESNVSLPADSIQEIVFSVGGVPVKANEIATVLFPNLGTDDSFDQDFTGFLYHDGTEVWPGYIFKVVDQNSTLENNMRIILEGSPVLAALYLDSPGVQDAGGFRDGLITTEDNTVVGTRYLPFSVDGASLNYGWFNDYLVLSTSFAGMQKAMTTLENTVDDGS